MGIAAIPAFIGQAAARRPVGGRHGAAPVRHGPRACRRTVLAQRCTEDLPGATEYQLDGVPEALQFLAARPPTATSSWIAAQRWASGMSGGTIHDRVTSDVPVLTLSGEFDALTPASSADNVRSTLSHLVRPPVPGRRPRGAPGVQLPDHGSWPASSPTRPRSPMRPVSRRCPNSRRRPARPTPGPCRSASDEPGSRRPSAVPDATPKPGKAPKARPVKLGRGRSPTASRTPMASTTRATSDCSSASRRATWRC